MPREDQKALSSGGGWVVAQMVLLLAGFCLPFALSLTLNRWPVWAGAAVMAFALSLAVWSMGTLGRSLTPLPRPRDDAVFVRSGPYRFVRHPIYAALIVLDLGWSLFWWSLPLFGLTLMLIVVFEFKSRLEERWLAHRYPEYRAYQASTGRLVPRIFK